jgi:competence protein ComEA
VKRRKGEDEENHSISPFHLFAFRPSLKLPYFSRSQVGVILLLGAVLFFLWAWRCNFGLTPAPAPQPTEPWVFVEVTGAVAHPGIHAFSQPPTLPEIWQKTGGPEPAPPATKDIASGSLIEIHMDGRYRLGRMAGPRLLTLGLPIDLNKAAKEDLEALPGLGPVLAGRIIVHRREHGPFRQIGDLQRVSGLGPQNLEQIRPYLTLESLPE